MINMISSTRETRPINKMVVRREEGGVWTDDTYARKLSSAGFRRTRQSGTGNILPSHG